MIALWAFASGCTQLGFFSWQCIWFGWEIFCKQSLKMCVIIRVFSSSLYVYKSCLQVKNSSK